MQKNPVSTNLVCLLAIAGSLLGSPSYTNAQIAAAPEVQPVVSLLRQQRLLSEAAGEKGARAFAKSQGWTPLFDGTGKTILQGPDQVHQGANGIVHVLEAKGGAVRINSGYGYSQGSSEWAVRSARRVLRSPITSAAEKAAARTILEAASKGRLMIHIVATANLGGAAGVPILKQTVACTPEATTLAQGFLAEFGISGTEAVDAVSLGTAAAGDGVAVVAPAVRSASEGFAAGFGRTVLMAGVKFLLPIAIVADVASHVPAFAQTEQHYGSGEITEQQREREHVDQASRTVGGLTGAAGTAWLGMKIIAPLAAMTGPAAPYVEVIAGLGFGVGGYFLGEEAAARLGEWAITKLHESGATIAEVMHDSWNWVQENSVAVWEKTIDGVIVARDWTRKAGGAIYASASQTIGGSYDCVSGKVARWYYYAWGN